MPFSFRVTQGTGQKLRMNRLKGPLPGLVDEETEAQRSPKVWSSHTEFAAKLALAGV